MPEQKEDLQIVMKASDILKKGEFTDAFKKVLELVLKIQKDQQMAISKLQETYTALLSSMENRHGTAYNDLKGQVDGVFVGKAVEKMMKEHEVRMSEMMAKMKAVDERMSRVRDGKTPVKGIDYNDGKPGLPGAKGLLDEKTLQALKDEWEEKYKKLANKPMGGGGKKIVYSKTMDLSSQVDGSKKVFILDERVLKVNYLQSSQFPFIYRKDIDFTATDLRVTLTSAVTAPALTQTLFVNCDLMFYSK